MVFMILSPSRLKTSVTFLLNTHVTCVKIPICSAERAQI